MTVKKQPVKQVTTVTKEEVPVEEPIEPEILAGNEEEAKRNDELSAFADSLGVDAAKCSIYRADEYGKWKFHGSCPPTIISEEYLQKTYRGGSYLVKFLNSKGVYLRSKQLDIADPVADDDEGALIDAPTGPQPFELEMARMREESNRQHELTLALIDKLGNNGQPAPQTNLTDVIAAVTALKDSTTAPNPISQMTELVGLIKVGVELGATGGMPDKSWLDHVKDGVKYLPDVIGAIKAGPPPPVPGAPAADPNEDPRIPALRWMINYLKPKALANRDSGLYVDLAMEEIADPKWAPLVGLVNAPYDEIAKIDTDLLQPQYRHWFEGLFSALREEIIKKHGQPAPIPDTTVADGESGDEGKPDGDVPASPGRSQLPFD